MSEERCGICAHPPHDGRCSVPATEERSTHKDGLIFAMVETTGNCACGLVDSLIASGLASAHQESRESQ